MVAVSGGFAVIPGNHLPRSALFQISEVWVVEKPTVRVPTVHLRGGSAIRRPLIVLAVCAVGVVGYLARDFLIPTAGAIVLALMLTPGRQRIRAGASSAARRPPPLRCSLLALVLAGLLAVAMPSLSSWIDQAPSLTYTLERKLEGLRKSLAAVKEVSDRVEQAATAAPAGSTATTTTEKVVVREKSLAGRTGQHDPRGCAADRLCRRAGLHVARQSQQTIAGRSCAFPQPSSTRVRLARVMRDINDRVGHYLFALAVIYSCVAAASAVALALLDVPNAIIWGVLMGLASFVPFVGAPVVIALVTAVALVTFDDWTLIVAAPAVLTRHPRRRIAVHHALLREPPLRPQHRGGVRRASRCSAGCGGSSAPSWRCRC